MARGKDGYSSLLVVPEGGECEEVVSEENGVLISTIIRQYFLSLKILGKWKRWGPSLDRHWNSVNKTFHEHHPVMDQTKEVSENANSTEGTETPLDESEEEDEIASVKPVEKVEEPQRDRDLVMARRVIKKWKRLAGVTSSSDLVDQAIEFPVNWTKVRFC